MGSDPDSFVSKAVLATEESPVAYHAVEIMVWLATEDRGVGAESGLTRYLEEIRRFPMLERREEHVLAKRWRAHSDLEAAHKLVTSHLRLVAKIAMGYRGYGLPLNDLISEGNIGLMQAVKRFDPDRGFRLATYAMWWIRAAIQEYILHSWSLVKMGTTAAQKKLFFNLRKLKGELQELGLRRDLLEKAMTHLNDRERHILSERRLKENPTTLEDLSQQYGISRERVRQIEVRAFEKLQKAIKAAAIERRLITH